MSGMEGNRKGKSKGLPPIRILMLNESIMRIWCNGIKELNVFAFLHALIKWSTSFFETICLGYPRCARVYMREKFRNVICSQNLRRVAVKKLLPKVHLLEEKVELLRLLTILTNISDEIYGILNAD